MARSNKAVRAHACSTHFTARGCLHKTSTQTAVNFLKARPKPSRLRYRPAVCVWVLLFTAWSQPSPHCARAQALSHLLSRRQHGPIYNPSAFLTIALNTALADPSTVKTPISFIAKAENSSVFCTSANHLLNVMAREGFRSDYLDPDCQAYLSRARPAVQTQVRPSSLLSTHLPCCLQCTEAAA